MNALLKLPAHSVLDQLRETDTPAVVSDLAGHVLLWNAGAERLLNRPAREALGRLCHDLLSGRDRFGNVFCHVDCAVRVMCRKEEPIQPFELVVDAARPTKTLHVSTLKVPGATRDADVIVHLFRSADRAGTGAQKVPGSALGASSLTARERAVLEQVSEGRQNKEIAQKLDISVATVRNHVHHILEKLGVHSKLEALALAYRAGWITEATGRRPGRLAFPLD
jgi:DNA-binding CsgD family transcriptional regulator